MRCAIVGAGATGTLLAEMIARRTDWSLIIADGDEVSIENLTTQVFYSKTDLGQMKAEVVVKKICKGRPFTEYVTGDNIGFLSGSDLIIDCADNFQTSFLLNSVGRREGAVMISIGAHRNFGQVMVLSPDGPCMRCVVGDNPTELGCGSDILPGLAEILASLAFITAIHKERYHNRMVAVNVDVPEIMTIRLRRDPNCRCSPRIPKDSLVKICRNTYVASHDLPLNVDSVPIVRDLNGAIVRIYRRRAVIQAHDRMRAESALREVFLSLIGDIVSGKSLCGSF